MAKDDEFEHDIEFDDLHPESDDESEIEVDLGEGAISKVAADDDTDDAEAAPDQAAAEEALDLDALLPPEPAVDDRYEKLETKLTEQAVSDKQNQAITKVQTEVSRLEAETTDLRKQLREAREKGDTDAEMSLEEQLDEKRLDLRESKRYLQWYQSDEFKTQLAKQEAPKDDGERDDPGIRRQQMRETLAANPEMARWLSKNRWFLNPRTPEERAATTMIQNLEPALVQKGLRTGEGKFYAEINKALGKRFPELVKADSGERSTIPSGGGEQGGHRRSTGKKVVITAEDKATMRKFGMDPSNPADLKAYAKEMR